MLKRFICIILLAAFLSTFLTCCYDSAEVDDEVYALALGVDNGVNNKVRITIQYPTYKSGGSSQDGQGSDKKGGGGLGASNALEGSNVHTIESSTILEALDLYGMAISRKVSLMHTKILVFSEDFARSGIEVYLAPLARFRETRRTMAVVVTKGTAEDFIKENKSNIGESLSKSIELMDTQSTNTSLFPTVMFNKFYRGILSTFEQTYTAYAGINNFDKLPPANKVSNAPLVTDDGFLPGDIPRSGVAKIDFAGTAVFDGDKMVGTLNSSETKYFLMVTGDFKRGFITLKDKYDPEAAIPLDVRPGRAPELKGHFENGVPVIDLKLKMEADIGAIQSRINYERLDKLQELNEQAASTIEQSIKAVIHKVQTEYKSDIFGFGHKLAQYFPTIQEWEKYNWLAHFQKAKVNVKVEMSIRRTGLMINSSPIRSIQGFLNTEGD